MIYSMTGFGKADAEYNGNHGGIQGDLDGRHHFAHDVVKHRYIIEIGNTPVALYDSR